MPEEDKDKAKRKVPPIIPMLIEGCWQPPLDIRNTGTLLYSDLLVQRVPRKDRCVLNNRLFCYLITQNGNIVL